MKLYVIMLRSQVGTDGVALALEKAARSRQLDFESIIVEETVVADLADRDVPEPALLYRIATTDPARTIESTLVLRHPNIFTTIYYPKTYPAPSWPYRELNEQLAAGLAVVPSTITDATWQGMSDAELGRRVGQLGGFPVIVKTLGLSHGQGVAKMEDISSLRQALAQPKQVILRKYLARYRHYRLIVVAGRVKAAIEYHVPENDFRTNAGEPVVTPVDVAELDPRSVSMSVAAVGLRSSALGGVDILVDLTDGTPYLAEANVPCYFARAIEPTGIDIAGILLDAMLKKQSEQAESIVKNSQ